jgi:antitoxin (DNA-binding transcriptional repressor) of toxin-antitoxin stability system
MRTIAIATLKAHLSAEVKKASGGEQIVVVDHNHPVALLAPLPTGLALARKAVSRYGFRDLAPLVSRDPLENLDEERADRW